MSRTQRRGRDRRDQLLDCAEELFFQKGFEAASIQDLMEAAGVSKGAVYHHFKSKEEVLEAICLRLAERSAASVAGIVSDPDADALQKLNAVFAALRVKKQDEWPRFRGSFESLLSPRNAALFYQITHAMNRAMSPLFTSVLQAGIDDGSFRITDAKAVAHILLHLEGAMQPVLEEATGSAGGLSGPEGASLVERRLGQIAVAMDRLLGLPDHTIVLSRPAGAGPAPQL